MILLDTHFYSNKTLFQMSKKYFEQYRKITKDIDKKLIYIKAKYL